jgi:hypothetical protein
MLEERGLAHNHVKDPDLSILSKLDISIDRALFVSFFINWYLTYRWWKLTPCRYCVYAIYFSFRLM